MTLDERLARAAAKFGNDKDETVALLLAAARRQAWRAAHGGKECSRCHEILPVSAYGPDGSRPDGLAHRCRRCDSARKKKT